MSVNSTGAVLCAVRTAWRPWMCTHARPPRVPTGQPLHDPSRSCPLPSFPQGLQSHLQGHWTSGLSSGGYFLRHVAFISIEAHIPSPGAPGLGTTCRIQVYPILSILGILRSPLFLLISFWKWHDRLLEEEGHGPPPLSPRHFLFPL